MRIFRACLFLLLLGPMAWGQDIRRLPLGANDIGYDPFSRRLYASIPASAGSSGNSITVLDPFAGTVGALVFVGSEPGKIAVPDTGRYLYVALDGAAAVRRSNNPA